MQKQKKHVTISEASDDLYNAVVRLSQLKRLGEQEKTQLATQQKRILRIANALQKMLPPML